MPLTTKELQIPLKTKELQIPLITETENTTNTFFLVLQRAVCEKPIMKNTVQQHSNGVCFISTVMGSKTVS